MTRALVTGASGFLGRHCVAALAARGHAVVALSRSGASVPGAARAIGCDLLDPAAVGAAVREAQADCLIHLAWHADPQDRWHTLANFDWLAASLSLARAFAEAGGTRIVFGSSSAVYDWGFETLSEADTPLRPASLYGAAKASVELSLGAAAAKLGVSFAAARIFFCYGPGEPAGRLVSDLIAGLGAKQRVRCTDGLQRRDFLHAADIGDALALIAQSSAKGAINVGSGRAAAVRDVVLTLADLLGGRDLVDLGAIPRSADDPPCIVADINRLTALGFAARFGLAEGLSETVGALLPARTP